MSRLKGNSATTEINRLLEKATDFDKDERYMATNDLCSILQNYANNTQKEGKRTGGGTLELDDSMEQRICSTILKQLDDQSNDVQSVAVKCLAILLTKVHETQIGEICKKLCSLILDGKDALRDIYAIGLKTLIADVPSYMGAIVIERLTSNLLKGISGADEEIKRECLDIMAELLNRFGHLMDQKDHESVMNVVVNQLLGIDQHRPVVRKRASICLGSLAVVASDMLLNHMVALLLDQIELSEKNSTNSKLTQTLIQTIGIISRTSVGYRLGCHLERIVPLFLRFCGDPTDESQENETGNEIRENCFPGIESFVLRCPREVEPFIPHIVEVAVGFMKYDPNYSYDEDDVEEMEENSEDEDFDDEEESAGSDDDDDGSWKVRKAAVKVIQALIIAKPASAAQFNTVIYEELISRCKEREENVRLDVIQCLTCFVEAVTLIKRLSSSAGAADTSSVALVQNKLKAIVAASCTLLTGQSIKSKSAAFTLTRALVAGFGAELNEHGPRLLTAVEKCLADKNQALRLDTFAFYRQMLENMSPAVLQYSFANVIPILAVALREDWYKLVAEALRVITMLIKTMRPIDSSTTGAFVEGFAYEPFAPVLYEMILSRLEAVDIDQEIKECAIVAMGTLYCHMGHCLTAELPYVLSLFDKRLENETTRIPALKALSAMASNSSVPLDLSSLISSSGKNMALYLRQNSRALKQLTLQTMATLLHSMRSNAVANSGFDASIIVTIFDEVATILADSDLYLANLAIQLCSTIMIDRESAVATSAHFKVTVYPKLCSLARSPLMQGQPLLSLISLLQVLVGYDFPQMGFNDLFAALYALPGDETEVAKQSLSNISKCIAGICLLNSYNNMGSEMRDTINENSLQLFIGDLKSLQNSVHNSAGSSALETKKQLTLLCVGEIGQYTDLTSTDNLHSLVVSFFEAAHSEDTKLAAAYALGHISIGNLDSYLPLILEEINSTNTNNSHQHLKYLLFNALKEIISALAVRNLDFQTQLSQILPVLLVQCKSKEESVRSIVAECLGILTAIPSFASQIMPVLLNLLQQGGGDSDEDKLTRRMIANAMRFTLSRSGSTDEVRQGMNLFLPMLDDPDLEVKKAVLLMINTAAHHNPQTIESSFATFITPKLVETLQVKIERVVDLGPFKHRVDDNLPLRKIALSCIETIADTHPMALDAAPVVAVMPLLLADKDEVQLQAHQVLLKLAGHYPGILVSTVDHLVAPLEKTITKKIDGTGPEAERALEVVKSGVRVVIALNKILGTLDSDVANISRVWVEFLGRLRANERYVAMTNASM